MIRRRQWSILAILLTHRVNICSRGYWGSLTITSHDADIIGLVQDSSSEDCWFSGGLTSKFEKPVVGVITKIDKDDSNPKQARSYLELAGCTTIFEVSSYTGEGVEALSQGFHDMVNKYRKRIKAAMPMIILIRTGGGRLDYTIKGECR